jgi:hypothetical protein
MNHTSQFADQDTIQNNDQDDLDQDDGVQRPFQRRTPQGKPFKKFDPQIIVEGQLRNGQNSDFICFSLKLLIVDLKFIVTIPEEGSTVAPVYVKFRIDWNQANPPGSVQIRG